MTKHKKTFPSTHQHETVKITRSPFNACKLPLSTSTKRAKHYNQQQTKIVTSHPLQPRRHTHKHWLPAAAIRITHAITAQLRQAIHKPTQNSNSSGSNNIPTSTGSLLLATYCRTIWERSSNSTVCCIPHEDNYTTLTPKISGSSKR